MNNDENTKYVKWGLTAAAVIAFGCVFFFLLEHISNLSMAHRMLTGILRPFIYGGVIAYLVTPLARKLAGLLGKPEGCMVADVLALLIALAVVMGIIGLIIPQIVNSLSRIFQTLPQQINAMGRELTEMTESDPEMKETIRIVTETIQDKVNGFFRGDIEGNISKVMGAASGALSTATGILSFFKDFLIGLIIALYVLSKRGQLVSQASLIVRGVFKPEWADWIEDEARFADKIFNGFFMGKIVDSLIVGVICFVCCLLMGFEAPLLIAVIVGVTNIIPFFGPFIGAVPCTLLLLLENPTHCAMFLVFVIILQQLDGNVIGPKILGDSTGLPALWVMFGILLFGGLWGVVGMLIGVPLTALAYDIVKQLTYKGIRKRGREDMIESYNAKFHPPKPAKSKKVM